MVAGGASEDDAFHAFFFDHFQIVLDEDFGFLFHPCADEGEATAPLLSAQESEIHSCFS